jgi:alpha-tubulin suppressor-like RCC1 family protein
MFVRKELFLDANLWTGGYALFGEIGNGLAGANLQLVPIPIGSLATWKQVATKFSTVMATKTDGSLWGWGYNFHGEIGDGTGSTTSSKSSPVQIGTLTNWKQVASGLFHTAAIKTDGTLWTWGTNVYGQLGRGFVGGTAATGGYYSSPVQVGALTNWKQVVSSSRHCTAIATDGTLWAWGSNTIGQLGLNNTAYYSSPVQVGALTSWKEIACGYNYNAAIKTDGTLWTWGDGSLGQLGTGLTVSYSSPIQVGNLTNWKTVACGYYHTLAIKTDGTLWTWGRNIKGQLGLGSIGVYNSPVQVGALTTWKQVSGGDLHSHMIKTDGTLWACGYNNAGQLGMGDQVNNYSSPIQIGNLTNWKMVSDGYRGAAYIQSTDLP